MKVSGEGFSANSIYLSFFHPFFIQAFLFQIMSFKISEFWVRSYHYYLSNTQKFEVGTNSLKTARKMIWTLI